MWFRVTKMDPGFVSGYTASRRSKILGLEEATISGDMSKVTKVDRDLDPSSTGYTNEPEHPERERATADKHKLPQLAIS